MITIVPWEDYEDPWRFLKSAGIISNNWRQWGDKAGYEMDAEVMPAYRCDGDDLSGDEAIGNLGSEICNDLCETLSGD
jgi:hypothetical protein